ncbi:hypothetical protein, partial [Psychrobacter sp. AOP31-A1-22]
LFGVLLASLALFFSVSYIYADKKSKDQLRNIDNPVRKISEQEKLYLNLHMQRFNLSYANEHFDNVYLIEGKDVVAHTFATSGHTQTKLRLDNKHIYFPYDMDIYIDNEANRIEVVIVKGHWPSSARTYYAIALNVNGRDLATNAKFFIGASSTDTLEVVSQRLETALEYDIRQSNIIYVEPAIFLIATILLLLFASWCTGIFFYIYMLFALGSAGLTIKHVIDIYQKHKAPQQVITVKGHLLLLKVRDIETLHKISLSLCLSSTYYLHVPYYITEKFPDFLETHEDIEDYSVDITAHKQSGYMLLSAQDTPSLEVMTENNQPSADKRGLVFFSIIFITWCYFSITDDVSDMVEIFNPTIYTINDGTKSYKQAIATLLILILSASVFFVTFFSFFHKSIARKSLKSQI